MDWSQVLTILGFTAAMFAWGMKKSENSEKNILSMISQDRIANAASLNEHRKETSEILRAIQQEMKDFHGRLCAIEERRK